MLNKKKKKHVTLSRFSAFSTAIFRRDFRARRKDERKKRADLPVQLISAVGRCQNDFLGDQRAAAQPQDAGVAVESDRRHVRKLLRLGLLAADDQLVLQDASRSVDRRAIQRQYGRQLQTVDGLRVLRAH